MPKRPQYNILPHLLFYEDQVASILKNLPVDRRKVEGDNIFRKRIRSSLEGKLVEAYITQGSVIENGWEQAMMA